MTTVKTSKLTGPALDWAVALCEGHKPPLLRVLRGNVALPQEDDPMWCDYLEYSTDWSQGGPIIEREDIAVWPDDEGGWLASANAGQGSDYHGPTPLIAAMRCLVASRLSETVEIPDELLEAL